MNNETTTLAAQIENLRADFVGTIGATLARYASTFIKRLKNDDFLTSSPFEYGYPTRQEDGSYRLNVWHEMTRYTFRIQVTFNVVGAAIYVQIVDSEGESTLLNTLLTLDHSGNDVGMRIGECFERKLTGVVAYSRDERF